MEIAFAFGRPDVDRFLLEIDHEQFEEWDAFFVLRPTGWTAMSLQTTRLSYVAAQTHSRKRLSEKSFVIKPGSTVASNAEMTARYEAMAIRDKVMEKLNGRKTNQQSVRRARC